MKSFQAISYKIDDLELAVKELASQIDPKQLLSNTVGIVYADFDTDFEALSAKLAKKFSFPFIGGSAACILNKSEGYVEFAISMIVLTADDVSFSVGMSAEINNDSDAETIRDFYHNLTEGHKYGEEKLIFALAAAPDLKWNNLSPDDLVKIYNEESNGTPILGGCAADDLSVKKVAVFSEGKWVDSGIATIVFYGNVNPIIYDVQSVSGRIQKKWNVTKAIGRNVYHVDGRSIEDAMADVGMIPPHEGRFAYYLSNSFECTKKTKDNDTIDMLRALFFLDMEEHKARFLGEIEEGMDIYPGLITADSVKKSVNEAMDVLFAELEKKGKENPDYHYSTILCISCMARYCIMLPTKNAEAESYLGKVPDGMELLGFYSLGEFCPHKGKKYGRMHNAYNNETFVVVAI